MTSGWHSTASSLSTLARLKKTVKDDDLWMNRNGTNAKHQKAVLRVEIHPQDATG
jgi:hypothetical protein